MSSYYRPKLVVWVSISQAQMWSLSMILIGTLKMTCKQQPEPIESAKKVKFRYIVSLLVTPIRLKCSKEQLRSLDLIRPSL